MDPAMRGQRAVRFLAETAGAESMEPGNAPVVGETSGGWEITATLSKSARRQPRRAVCSQRESLPVGAFALFKIALWRRVADYLDFKIQTPFQSSPGGLAFMYMARSI